MKMIGHLCWALGFVSVVSTIDAISLYNKIDDQQLYDSSLSTDDSSKAKRPFCNAFTGCGKKRSLDFEDSMDNQEQLTNKIRIPVGIYRALLRAASHDNRHKFENREPRIDEIEYSDSNEIPRGERYQMN